MRVLALASSVLSLGCQAFAEPPRFHYVDCIPSADGNYVETFDRALPIATRCWQTENVEAPGYVHENDGDLIIHPSSDLDSQWIASEQAAFVFHEVAGDFLAVARVEAVSGSAYGDHCLNEGEAAGLVVRRREPLAWTNLLVRPDLTGEMLIDPDFCGDSPDGGPLAQITTASFGFDAVETTPIAGRGADAEADIAVCRKDDQLYYFVQKYAARADATLPPNLEAAFAQLEIGFGRVDVGLTATAMSLKDTQREGHFNWLVLRDYGETRMPEGCRHVLEAFDYPEEE
jgi:hypothetical protein